jgi:hypothetical protein
LAVDVEAVSLTRAIPHLKTLSTSTTLGLSDAEGACAAHRSAGMISVPGSLFLSNKINALIRWTERIASPGPLRPMHSAI